MGQIRYLINACLILIVSIVSYAVLHLLFSVPFIKEKEEEAFWCGTVTPLGTTSNTEGKKLFQQNCQTCHALDKQLTGPALRGFTERGPWDKKENIYKWIHNPSSFMKKDKYTQGLKVQYGSIMQAFPQLSTNQIDSIVAYISQPPIGY